MQLFDTHCHYNLEPLLANWQKLWGDSQQAGINRSLIVGTTLASSQLAVEQASSDERLYASLGIHPGHVDQAADLEQAVSELKKMAANKQVIAFGEVGLDYYHLSNNLDQQAIKIEQKHLFLAMINLAKEANLPLILHVRDRGEAAYFETLELLEKHWSFEQAIIFHCVSGPLEYVRRALAMKNSYFGFDGNLTFKNAHYQREIFELVQQADSRKILLETDAPYLAPEPYRGQVCEPAMITSTANFAGQKLGLDLNLTYQNSLRAFGLL